MAIIVGSICGTAFAGTCNIIQQENRNNGSVHSTMPLRFTRHSTYLPICLALEVQLLLVAFAVNLPIQPKERDDFNTRSGCSQHRMDPYGHVQTRE